MVRREEASFPPSQLEILKLVWEKETTKNYYRQMRLLERHMNGDASIA